MQTRSRTLVALVVIAGGAAVALAALHHVYLRVIPRLEPSEPAGGSPPTKPSVVETANPGRHPADDPPPPAPPSP